MSSPDNQVQPQVHQTVKPRVGDIIPDGSFGEPWKEGSNIHPSPTPTYLTQRRPYKYSAFQALLDKIEAGIDEKLGSADESATVSFEHWMRLQSHNHIRFGMDTVFRIPNEA